MGQILVKTGSGWVGANSVYTKTGSGWVAGNNVYAKSGTGWMASNPFDTTSPGYPIKVSTTYNQDTRSVTIKMRASSDSDVTHMVLKYSSVDYPLWAHDEVGLYPWSWKSCAPDQEITYTFQLPAYNRDYFVSVWCVDDSGNASPRNRQIVRVTPPSTAPPPPVTPTIKKVTYNCTDSGTWNLTNTFWSTSLGKRVGAAGAYDHRGGWMYGTKLAAALTKSTKIRGMTIKITRENSAHGVSGPANVYLIGHGLTSPGSGSNKPLAPVSSPYNLLGELNRGQTKTFVIPSSLYAGVKDGTWRGFGIGIWNGPTPYTSKNYIICHGKGTTSGQVYMEWEE